MKKNIALSDGSIMELEYDEPFNAKVRQYFDLGDDVEPSDEQIKTFFYKTCKVALDKAEEEMKRDGSWD